MEFCLPSQVSVGGNTTAASIRCVYDTWYWGDKPESRDTYHPGPTIYNN